MPPVRAVSSRRRVDVEIEQTAKEMNIKMRYTINTIIPLHGPLRVLKTPQTLGYPYPYPALTLTPVTGHGFGRVRVRVTSEKPGGDPWQSLWGGE
jgi:hypothetical protein